jgi:DNA-binding CsgD family transcriptional regulator
MLHGRSAETQPPDVSHHLYRAFPKLGVTNRTALARLDLTGPDDLP